MKLLKIDFPKLRNDEHFQFHTEFLDLVNVSPIQVKLLKPLATYTTLFRQEDEALKKITKSVFTEDIQDADHRRDTVFRGLVSALQAALDHFDPLVHGAARRVRIPVDAYGNLAKKPLNEETSAIYNLVKDLRNDPYKEDVKTAGLTPWVEELGRLNTLFEALVKARYDEAASRTALVLRTVRAELDEAYRTIADRIDALALLDDGEEEEIDYDAFIRRLNIVVEKYNNTIAQRHGHSVAKEEKEKKEKKENSPQD